MMGKWLEILSERPADTVGYAGRRPLILAEIAPHPVLEAGRLLGPHRPQFPMLDLVRKDSSAYVDGWPWLDRGSMEELLAEIRRLRRIGRRRREEFLKGLDGRRYHDHWRGREFPGPFEAWLDRIEEALGVEGGRWALRSLKEGRIMGDLRLFVAQVVMAREEQWFAPGTSDPPIRSERRYYLEFTLYADEDAGEAYEAAS